MPTHYEITRLSKTHLDQIKPRRRRRRFRVIQAAHKIWSRVPVPALASPFLPSYHPSGQASSRPSSRCSPLIMDSEKFEKVPSRPPFSLSLPRYFFQCHWCCEIRVFNQASDWELGEKENFIEDYDEKKINPFQILILPCHLKFPTDYSKEMKYEDIIKLTWIESYQVSSIY